MGKIAKQNIRLNENNENADKNAYKKLAFSSYKKKKKKNAVSTNKCN